MAGNDLEAPGSLPRNPEQEPLLAHTRQPTSRPISLIRSRPELLPIDKAPYWVRDKNILTGYRPSTESIADCLESWTYLHNESVNIYTHMVPAFFLVLGEILLYRNFPLYYPKGTSTDQWMFAILIFSAIFCMSLSTGFHTLMNHSYNVSELWLRFDYIGIIGLILGSILSGLYMAFYCLPRLLWFYSGMILTLGALSAVIVVYPQFQEQSWRTIRTAIFVGLAFSSVLPLTHALFIFGPTELIERSGLPYYLLEGLLYMTGVFFYLTRIPESLRPGQFDIWFSAHQLFHVLVVLAAMSHVTGVWHAYDYNYARGLICEME